MRKFYTSLVCIMLIAPTSFTVYAENTEATEEKIENVEEVIEVEGDSEEWLEDAIEAEPEEEVVLEGYENLGPMIFKSSAISSKIAANKEGKYFIYYIMHGSPAALIVVDYDTKEILHSFTLEDSKSAWGLDVDEDGKLWVGGSVSSTLYSYDPNTTEFEKHGAIFSNKSDTSIQDLIVSGNKVFAGSAYGGSLVSFNTDTKEIEEFGQIRYKREFLKAVVADEKTEEVFISLGSPMDLLVKKANTSNFKSFLPSKYLSEKYAQDLVLTDKYIIARLNPSNVAVIFDRQTLKIYDEFELSSKTVSTVSPNGESLYYTKNAQLVKYDLESKRHTELGVSLPSDTEAINLDFIIKKPVIEENSSEKEMILEGSSTESLNIRSLSPHDKVIQSNSFNKNILLKEDSPEDALPEVPNETEQFEFVLSGMVDNLGQLFEYNPQTGEMTYHQMDLPEQPVELYTLTSSSDGTKIFANGYMSGGLGIYDVNSGTKELYRNISQVETMYDINNKLYLGVYPLARFIIYDRTLPWAGENPKEIIRMNQYGQERTTALTPYKNGEEIVLGTLPETSVGGGALAFYDTKSGNMEIYENYIYNQSIVSLVSRGNEIFGGTSIHANHKANPRGARLFYFDRNNPDSKKYIHLPFNSSMITSLIVDSENKVWGMADGKLFVYTDEWTDVEIVELLPLISGRFRNAKIVEGTDGYIYGSVEGKFFRISKNTLQVEWLKDKNVYGLEKDKQGNLYYYDGSNLWKYTIEKNRLDKQILISEGGYK